MALALTTEDDGLKALRAEVRSFLAAEVASGAFVPTVDSWLSAWDPEFSRRLAARGWVGMTVPVEYGGHGLGFLERFVVTEELLAVGAPVAAHWIADRQMAPSILAHGSEAQKLSLVPRIARGELFFAIGMSEPESGSDLASVRTRATPVEGGWSITGSKVWTSGAHLSDFVMLLARTSPDDPQHRHAGLSQFILDLHAPGVDIRPIVSMNGHHHFNEIFLAEVFVADDMVLGGIGDGWHQVTSELGFERSGPERFMSTAQLLDALATAMRDVALPTDPGVGRLFARTMGLHSMSLSVAGALSRAEPADVAAAMVKDLGTITEGDIAEYAAAMPSGGGGRLDALRDAALLGRPGFTLRGGTNEVLRGVVARGLGLR